MLEKVNTERERTIKRSRRIKVPGKPETYDNKDPIDIARELRAKSKLGKREANLNAAARKARNGR